MTRYWNSDNDIHYPNPGQTKYIDYHDTGNFSIHGSDPNLSLKGETTSNFHLEAPTTDITLGGTSDTTISCDNLGTGTVTNIGVDGSGNILISDASTREVKQNIQNYEETPELFKNIFDAMSFVTYEYKTQPDISNFGLVIEDIRDALENTSPEALAYLDDHLLNWRHNKPFAFRSHGLTMFLMAQVKDLSNRVAALEQN